MGVYYLYSLMAVIVPSIFGVITLIGSVGNILVIIVVASNKTVRNTPNILILNLAVTDLIFLVLCVPFTAARYAMIGRWSFGIVMCKIVYYMINVSFFGSAYTLVLMAISRYIAIVHSIKSLVLCTARNTYIAISAMWMAILIGSSYYLRVWTLNIQYYDNKTNTNVYYCDSPYLYNPYEMQKYAMCIFVLGYALPLVIITILYSVLLHHLFNNVVTGDETVKSAADIRSKKRVSKMLVVVIAVFAICWFPEMALRLIGFYHDMGFNDVFYVCYIASNCLGYFNSCVNPFIYALLSPQFRKGFQKLLCCSGRDFQERRTTAASGKTTTLRLSGETPAENVA